MTRHKPRIVLETKQYNTLGRLRKLGMSLEDCAKGIGISRSTLKRMQRRDDAQGERVREVLAKAEVARNESLLKCITDAAESKQPHSWKAAAWILERRNPRQWSKPETRLALNEVAEQVENPLEGWQNMTKKEKREKLRALHGWT